MTSRSEIAARVPVAVEHTERFDVVFDADMATVFGFIRQVKPASIWDIFDKDGFYIGQSMTEAGAAGLVVGDWIAQAGGRRPESRSDAARLEFAYVSVEDGQ